MAPPAIKYLAETPYLYWGEEEGEGKDIVSLKDETKVDMGRLNMSRRKSWIIWAIEVFVVCCLFVLSTFYHLNDES